jgi:hypothetical protein
MEDTQGVLPRRSRFADLKGSIILKCVDLVLPFHEVKAGKAEVLDAWFLDADAHRIGINGGSEGLIPNAIVDDVLGF